MSWLISDLKKIEYHLISAYQRNLRAGFGESDSIREYGVRKHSTTASGRKILVDELHDYKFCKRNTAACIDKDIFIRVEDSWSEGSPSIGTTRIFVNDSGDFYNPAIAWSMNYADEFFPNSYVSHEQVMSFLRDAIVKYDPKTAETPFRGLNGHTQPVCASTSDKQAGYWLQYDIIADSDFGNAKIVERIDAYNVTSDSVVTKLATVFQFEATCRYLNLASTQ